MCMYYLECSITILYTLMKSIKGHDVCNFNSETQIIIYFKDLLVITCRDYCKLVIKYRNCY